MKLPMSEIFTRESKYAFDEPELLY